MSQSATWDTLQVARDARLCGRPEVAAELMREVEQDLAAYSHMFCRTVLRKEMPEWSRWQQHRMLEWVGNTPAASRHYIRLNRLSLEGGRPMSFVDDVIDEDLAVAYARNLGLFMEGMRSFGQLPLTIVTDIGDA